MHFTHRRRPEPLLSRNFKRHELNPGVVPHDPDCCFPRRQSCLEQWRAVLVVVHGIAGIPLTRIDEFRPVDIVHDAVVVIVDSIAWRSRQGWSRCWTSNP